MKKKLLAVFVALLMVGACALALAACNKEPGTEKNPYTVAELIELGEEIGQGNYSESQVYVKGIIVSDITVSNSTGAYMFYIADEAGASINNWTTVQVWYAISDAHPWENDTVVVYGYVQNYSGKIETCVSKDSKNSEEHKITSITRGTSQITKSETNATITLSKTSGLNESEFTFTVTAAQDYTISSVKVNNVDVTATNGTYTAKIQGATTVAAVATKPITGETPVEINFATKFGTYASDWSTTYASKTLSALDLGVNGTDFTITMSNAAKQTQTITTLPVVASKDADVYVTFTIGGQLQIKSLTLNLQEWTNSKKFKTLALQYTTDGSTWTDVAGVGVKDATTKVAISDGYATLSAESLPAGVIAVRFVCNGDNASTNQQVGISSISAVVAPKA